MEMTKVVKCFIRRGWPNTSGNIVYINENSFIENLAVSKYSMWHREANNFNNK